MKKILSLIFVIIITTSCTKQDEKKVIYRASNAVSEYTVQYYDAGNNLQTVNVYPESTQDIWQKEVIKNEGDIVYLSGKYNDINSALKLQILIDGKVFKQTASSGDTLKYLVVSGTIPFDY
jgi:hypothetical protein